MKTTIDADLFADLCEAIRRSPLPLEAIAAEAGVSGAILYCWLTGKVTSPRIRTMEKVAKALDRRIVHQHGPEPRRILSPPPTPRARMALWRLR
jgi:DNA-binding phage protein